MNSLAPSPVRKTTPELPERPSWRGIIHSWAAPLAATAGVTLAVVTAVRTGHASTTLAVVVYTMAVTAMLTTSAVYHRVFWTNPVARRMDHSMIFVAVAGTYTPAVALGLPKPQAWWFLGACWAVGIVGVAVRMIWFHVPRWLVISLYLAQGWMAVWVLPSLIRGLGALAMGIIAAGGVLYSLGAVVYATKRPNPSPRFFGYHEVFHSFVTGALALQFAGVSIAVLTRG